MGNPNDLYADSTHVDAFPPLDVNLLADGDTDLRIVAMFPMAVYG
jgi:hypothetical protein